MGGTDGWRRGGEGGEGGRVEEGGWGIGGWKGGGEWVAGRGRVEEEGGGWVQDERLEGCRRRVCWCRMGGRAGGQMKGWEGGGCDGGWERGRTLSLLSVGRFEARGEG